MGTTSTEIGYLLVIGVCVPYYGNHMKHPTEPKARWEDHLRFLEGLSVVVRALDPGKPVLVLGDFNQTLPRQRAPQLVYERLVSVFDGVMGIATAGRMAGFAGPVIDHLAHSHAIRAIAIDALPNVGKHGERLSDHVGMSIQIHPA